MRINLKFFVRALIFCAPFAIFSMASKADTNTLNGDAYAQVEAKADFYKNGEGLLLEESASDLKKRRRYHKRYGRYGKYRKYGRYGYGYPYYGYRYGYGYPYSGYGYGYSYPYYYYGLY